MAPTSAAFVKQATIAALLLGAANAGATEEAACPWEAPAGAGAGEVGEAFRHDPAEAVSLISLRSHRSRKVHSHVTCSKLTNKETHFTVDVAVGTPSQTFAIVADTGSNSLIITSCVCEDQGYCDKENRCFTGTEKSDTFKFDPKAEEMILTFGSGEIQAAPAVDIVQVAGVKCNMTDGLLLMTDQQLDFGGPFEGILGLGPPLPAESDKEEVLNDTSSSIDSFGDEADIWKKIFGNAGMGGSDYSDPLASEATKDSGMLARKGVGADKKKKKKKIHQPIGFLEQANISRFSLCFNPGDDGVLRLGTPENLKAHAAVGQEHWGLGLEGISVGNSASMLQALAAKVNGSAAEAKKPKRPDLSALCSKESMKKGQKTPCGIIPDSGTTQIMAPQAHLDALMEAICDQWPRCKSNYTALMKAVDKAEETIINEYTTNPFEFKVQGKGEVLDMLLVDCDAWLNDDTVDELPAVHFYVTGNETKQKITIPARTWLVEKMEEEKEEKYMHVDGFGDVAVGSKGTGKKTKVCVPSFGAMEYETGHNGPVWILGTPVFYEYMVGYDMKQRTISMTSQSEESCGQCDQKVGLITSQPSRQQRSLRRQLGKPRVPSIDVHRPL